MKIVNGNVGIISFQKKELLVQEGRLKLKKFVSPPEPYSLCIKENDIKVPSSEVEAEILFQEGYLSLKPFIVNAKGETICYANNFSANRINDIIEKKIIDNQPVFIKVEKIGVTHRISTNDFNVCTILTLEDLDYNSDLVHKVKTKLVCVEG